MARDLIPPPSPAGRPSPDPEPAAAAGARATAELQEATGLADKAAATPSAPSPYRPRFGFVLGALAGVAVAAAITFFALLGSSSHDGAATTLADHWSTWLPPSGDVISGPPAIAEHVQGAYKRDDGKQLVSVKGGPLVYINQGTPLPFSVKLEPEDGSILDLGSSGVLYTLTGTGKSGRIVGDKATVERHTLLRREALELALYSFRYLDDITMVVALLPLTDPATSAKATKKQGKARAKAADDPPQLQAVFYRPGDLEPQLRSPLTVTLEPAPPKPKQLAQAQSRQIDALTKDNLFLASFQQQPDGQLYLVLARSASGH